MSKKRRCCVLFIIHLAIWGCLFLYPFLFHHIPFSDGHAVLRVFLFLLLLSGSFYANIHLLIPKLLGTKRLLFYFISIALLIGSTGYACGYLQVFFNDDIHARPGLFYTSRNTGLIVSFLVWVISSLLKITGEWFRNDQLRKQSEHERIRSELSFLKTQVNPHFLFNALNNIYALNNKKSPHTGEAILKLSNLARYMLYEASAEFVPLRSEIDHLKSYIDLQKLGLDDIAVNFSVKGDVDKKKIEPLLLIPLVENAFKHGISYETRDPIDITLEVNANELLFKVENYYSDSDVLKDKTNGIGLINLKRRLEALYPEKHTLKTGRQGNKFKAELKLRLIQ
jgi:two-component system LytT family sensor kinase